MAGRLEKILKKTTIKETQKAVFNKPGIKESLEIYTKMSQNFTNESYNNVCKWMKDIMHDAIKNPDTVIDVAKYIFLFINVKETDSLNAGAIRKCFLVELESTYKEYLEESDTEIYRNFTYFFGACMYFTREPSRIPIKDILSALLTLISKLDIFENTEDSIVYSKCVAWISNFMIDEMRVGAVIMSAYIEALNRLRELNSSGKGSLVSLGCLESSINGGALTNLGKEFYKNSLPRTDFMALDKDFSIVIPECDKDKYILKYFNNVIFV